MRLINPRLTRAVSGMQRRVFLKALALGVSVPVAIRMARLAVAANSGAVKRMLVVYLPHGIAPEHYNPKVQEGDPTQFALNDTNESILGALEPYKQYVNVYQGFGYAGNFNAHEGVVNFLSGVNTGDATTARTSVEHVIGKALGVKPLILGACSHQGFGLESRGMVFWNGQPVDPEKSPVTVADRLFTGTAAMPPPASSGTAQVNPEIALRNELLQLTEAEIADLRTTVTGLSQEDSKLQTHLMSIQSLKTNTDTSGGSNNPDTPRVVSCSSVPNMPSVEKVRAASAGQVVDSSGGNDYFYQEANFPLIYEAQMELAAQALICGAAPVIGVQAMYTTCGFDFSFAGAPGSHHDSLSHTNPAQSPDYRYDSPPSIDNVLPTTRVNFAKAQIWFTKMLVDKVVSVLAATDDPTAPGTSVLDNTLIYWTSEVADGALHYRTSWVEFPGVPAHLPLVTIGKAGGALQSGQVISFPIGKNEDMAPARPATDLYLTLASAMGANSVSFPDTTGNVTEALT